MKSSKFAFEIVEVVYEQSQEDDLSCICEGSATVTVIEGCPPFTFNWSTGNSVTTSSNTDTEPDLCEGSYWVGIIDLGFSGVIDSCFD